MHCFLTEHLFLPRYLAKCQRFPEKEVIAPASGVSQSLNGHISKPLPSSAMVEKERKKQQQQKNRSTGILHRKGTGPAQSIRDEVLEMTAHGPDLNGCAYVRKHSAHLRGMPCWGAGLGAGYDGKAETAKEHQPMRLKKTGEGESTRDFLC